MNDIEVMTEVRWLLSDPAMTDKQARRALRHFFATIDKEIRKVFLAVTNA